MQCVLPHATVRSLRVNVQIIASACCGRQHDTPSIGLISDMTGALLTPPRNLPRRQFDGNDFHFPVPVRRSCWTWFISARHRGTYRPDRAADISDLASLLLRDRDCFVPCRLTILHCITGSDGQKLNKFRSCHAHSPPLFRPRLSCSLLAKSRPQPGCLPVTSSPCTYTVSARQTVLLPGKSTVWRR